MANRNQDYQTGSRRQQSQDWRNEDRDYGEDEGQSSVRSGSYDEGRVQYGRGNDRERDRERYGQPDDQSGSTGRSSGYGYGGYGDFGRGDYGGGRSGWSGQDRYGQSGY